MAATMLNGNFFINSCQRNLAAPRKLVPEKEKRVLVRNKGISIKEVSIVGAILTALGSSESSKAVQQAVAEQGGGDYRGLAILIPIIPAVGWALLNILRPARNQLEQMRKR